MTDTETATFAATRLPLAKIRPGQNPRRYFDQGKHDELVASLRMRGMLQPILLRPTPVAGEFVIVAGERRHRAALVAFGADGDVPVIIRELTDQEALEAAIDENDIREDASETEQADAAVRALAACQDDRAEAARRLGWSTAKLDRRLALAHLSEAVKVALDERRIKVGHAELLAAVPLDKQERALDTILSAGLDVAGTRAALMRMTQGLASALFDKTECTTCPFNSASQRALFETHVEDGHCTNPGCFQLKTEAADAARQAEKERAAAATVPPVTKESPSVGACRICGCTEDRACEGSCSWTDKTRTLCNNPDCVAKAAEPAPTPSDADKGKTQAPAPTPSTKTASRPAATPQPPVTAKTILHRVVDIREAAWRAALFRTVDRDPVFAAAFDSVLRNTWQIDAAFLGRLNKDELKFVAQECGLVAHMGEKAFAKLLTNKPAAVIAGMLNATGFSWAGRLPSAITLNGKYGPPLATPTAQDKD
ncbi:hypothetical protein BH10PSE14_BH10PSE14_06470 [soil metagenome]